MMYLYLVLLWFLVAYSDAGHSAEVETVALIEFSQAQAQPILEGMTLGVLPHLKIKLGGMFCIIDFNIHIGHPVFCNCY